MKKVFQNLIVASALFATLFVASCKQDPCATVTCKNSGTCANGSCNCPSGYGGSDCGTEKVPSKIRISKIEVLDFPATTSSGGGWDPASGADIFPRISDVSQSTTLFAPTTYYMDAVAGSTYSWDIVPSLDIDAQTQYTFSLYDYDTTDPNDFMAGVVVALYQSGRNFPTTLTLTAPGSNIKFRLTLSYIF